jgi:glutaredoxin
MIIKFYTEGCAPCKAVGHVLDNLKIDYDEVDIGKDIESAIHHKVRSVPTILNTETGATLVGFDGIYKTEEWINDNCS